MLTKQAKEFLDYIHSSQYILDRAELDSKLASISVSLKTFVYNFF